MALFKKKAHSSHISLRLAPRPQDGHFYTSPDHYLSNEIVSGCAIVKLAPGVEFSHAKITLKGSIKATVEDTHKGAMGKNWRTEYLPFLGVIATNTGRKAAVKGDDGTIRVPFRLNLARCEGLTSFVSELPPSLDSRLEGEKAWDCQYEISYTLTATAFSSKSTLATVAQKIFVLPVSPDALSAEHSEAPNEYHWAELHPPLKPKINRLNSTSSSVSTTTTGPRIEIAGQEPEAIVFNPETAVPDGSTEIPFVIKWSPRKGEEPQDLPTRCHVKTQLVTKTHITPDGLKQIGSQLEFMRTGGNHVTRSMHGFDREASIPISGWETAQSATVDPFSVARFSFLYHIQHDKPPMPTFFTPLLSRRYFLEISLAFPERPHDIFRLSLPVEVAHGTVDAGSDVENKDSRECSPGVEARL